MADTSGKFATVTLARHFAKHRRRPLKWDHFGDVQLRYILQYYLQKTFAVFCQQMESHRMEHILRVILVFVAHFASAQENNPTMIVVVGSRLEAHTLECVDLDLIKQLNLKCLNSSQILHINSIDVKLFTATNCSDTDEPCTYTQPVLKTLLRACEGSKASCIFNLEMLLNSSATCSGKYSTINITLQCTNGNETMAVTEQTDSHLSLTGSTTGYMTKGSHSSFMNESTSTTTADLSSKIVVGNSLLANYTVPCFESHVIRFVVMRCPDQSESLHISSITLEYLLSCEDAVATHNYTLTEAELEELGCESQTGDCRVDLYNSYISEQYDTWNKFTVQFQCVDRSQIVGICSESASTLEGITSSAYINIPDAGESVQGPCRCNIYQESGESFRFSIALLQLNFIDDSSCENESLVYNSSESWCGRTNQSTDLVLPLQQTVMIVYERKVGVNSSRGRGWVKVTSENGKEFGLTCQTSQSFSALTSAGRTSSPSTTYSIPEAPEDEDEDDGKNQNSTTLTSLLNSTDLSSTTHESVSSARHSTEYTNLTGSASDSMEYISANSSSSTTTDVNSNFTILEPTDLPSSANSISSVTTIKDPTNVPVSISTGISKSASATTVSIFSSSTMASSTKLPKGITAAITGLANTSVTYSTITTTSVDFSKSSNATTAETNSSTATVGLTDSSTTTVNYSKPTATTSVDFSYSSDATAAKTNSTTVTIGLTDSSTTTVNYSRPTTTASIDLSYPSDATTAKTNTTTVTIGLTDSSTSMANYSIPTTVEFSKPSTATVVANNLTTASANFTIPVASTTSSSTTALDVGNTTNNSTTMINSFTTSINFSSTADKNFNNVSATSINTGKPSVSTVAFSTKKSSSTTGDGSTLIKKTSLSSQSIPSTRLSTFTLFINRSTTPKKDATTTTPLQDTTINTIKDATATPSKDTTITPNEDTITTPKKVTTITPSGDTTTSPKNVTTTTPNTDPTTTLSRDTTTTPNKIITMTLNKGTTPVIISSQTASVGSTVSQTTKLSSMDTMSATKTSSMTIAAEGATDHTRSKRTTGIAVGVTLTVIAVFAAGIIAYYIMKRRKRASSAFVPLHNELYNADGPDEPGVMFQDTSLS
ncbi:serine-rich adhesin for platelets-like [Watersipora subatra]|uniref:serine-rich adhesin for platelets-like n=1 Tax=Watersipora subatra TaxID=2589382 RepID=UPI00355AFB15